MTFGWDADRMVGMVMTHRTRRGEWTRCRGGESCQLPFHVPDMTPQEATALPLRTLLPLFEVVQPPTGQLSPTEPKYWGRYGVGPRGFETMQFHREYDLPALVYPNGKLAWYLNNREHRAGGKPARISPDGLQEWYEFGNRHRVDGPAIIYADGSDEWWYRGLRHREGGPAIDWRPSGGAAEYWWHGHAVTAAEVGA